MTDRRGAQVSFDGVGLHYPGAGHAALSDVTLDIASGETVVVLGPSGCGKSTLLRTINRLIVPDRGSIRIDGVDIASVDAIALRRSIGYVIQSTGLFPHLDVAQNIGFVPSLLGWDAARIATRVDELLSIVQLDAARYRTRRVASLSGGEAQRVGVARAFAAGPKVLLMDEPFAALDPVVRRELQDRLREIVRDFGTTTVFVTHDVDEALYLADRVVVMQAGRILQHASPIDILRSPTDTQVADLLGTQSLMRRLALIPVAAAARLDETHASGLPLLQGTTLHDALNFMLAHPGTPAFRVDARHSLSFSDIAAAAVR